MSKKKAKGARLANKKRFKGDPKFNLWPTNTWFQIKDETRFMVRIGYNAVIPQPSDQDHFSTQHFVKITR